MSALSLLSAKDHVWRFFRAGGLDQIKFEKGSDLTRLAELDPKLWVALSCPAADLEFDNQTLALIDTDGDGRIRVPEILAAVKWATGVLRSADSLIAGGPLPLAAIDDSTETGRQLLSSARRILAAAGRPEASTLSVADTSDRSRIFAATRCNGDGVVTAASTADPSLLAVIAEILATLGGKPDRSGQSGVDQALVDAFFGHLQAYSGWWAQAEAQSQPGAGVLPLGEATPAAYAALEAVRTKIDDYFARCALAAFDPRAAGPLNRAEAEFTNLASQDLSHFGPEVVALPLAHVEAGRPLPLATGLNPAWAAAVERFTREVVRPLAGDLASLSASAWGELQAKFASFAAWQSSKAGAPVEKLGIARVRALLAGGERAGLAALIAEDLALAPEMAAIDQVDRLTRYHRDLVPLLNNYVSFPDFYARDRWAVFQAGTLYLDGRSCNLCLKVTDAGKHGALAALSKLYLAYCDCTRKDGGKMSIVAGFTAGDSDQLLVGRNGIFIDRKGRDWDATITKIVDNPISIRQAFWSPYKKFIKLVEDQIEKFASSREKAVQEKAAVSVASAADKAQAPAPSAPAAPFDIGKTVGIFAAIGLALGAIGTALAALVKSFLGLVWWQMPLAFLAVMLLISGPSMLIAALKLRQRVLGPVLDASGWAINGRVRITFALGGALTQVASFPPNSIRSLEDPYEDKKNGRKGFLTLLIVLLLVGAGLFWYLQR